VSPSDRTVLRGGATSYTVTVGLVSGSTTVGLPATVALSLSGAPADATPTLAASVAFPSSSATPVTTPLNITTGATSLGDSVLTVTGTITGGSRAGSANLHIFDFLVTVSPADRTVLRGCPTSYTVTVSLVSGSSVIGLPATLPLALSGAPADATTTLA